MARARGVLAFASSNDIDGMPATHLFLLRLRPDNFCVGLGHPPIGDQIVEQSP